MSFFRKFIAQLLPTDDINVLELRRVIKNQKKRINYLEKEARDNSVQFYDYEIYK